MDNFAVAVRLRCIVIHKPQPLVEMFLIGPSRGGPSLGSGGGSDTGGRTAALQQAGSSGSLGLRVGLRVDWREPWVGYSGAV